MSCPTTYALYKEREGGKRRRKKARIRKVLILRCCCLLPDRGDILLLPYSCGVSPAL